MDGSSNIELLAIKAGPTFSVRFAELEGAYVSASP